jgi:hypothetical protein
MNCESGRGRELSQSGNEGIARETPKRRVTAFPEDSQHNVNNQHTRILETHRESDSSGQKSPIQLIYLCEGYYSDMGIDSAEEEFLRPPRSAASPHLLLVVLANFCDSSSTQHYEPVLRDSSVYNPLDTFRLPPGQERQYQQQYGDMYFLRLVKLKPAVEAVAIEAWEGLNVWDSNCNRILYRYFPSAC